MRTTYTTYDPGYPGGTPWPAEDHSILNTEEHPKKGPHGNGVVTYGK